MDATSRRDRVYLSEDSISATTQRISDVDLLYPPEYLNSLPIPGLPLHNLTLTINCPMFILMSRIADITDGCAGSKINVRILRRWAPRFRPNEMWFLAVDQFSDAIQILSIDDGGGFGGCKFQLNRCYSLDAYTCTEADKYQRFIKNPIYITVGRASKINQVPDSDELPSFWFSFASIAYLESLTNSDTDYPDVIGYFNGCKKLSTKNKNTFVKLDLIHESGRSLPVTLWKECVSIPEKFDPAFTTSIPLNTVLYRWLLHPASPSAVLLESRARASDLPDPLAHMTVITIENLKSMDYDTFL
ncbi:hypothetical protein LXL04_003727 [Taraxacum kok-saghyz]